MTDTKYLVIGKDEKAMVVNTDEGAQIMAEDPRTLVVFPVGKVEPRALCVRVRNKDFDDKAYYSKELVENYMLGPGDVVVFREWCIPENIYSGRYHLMVVNKYGEFVSYWKHGD